MNMLRSLLTTAMTLALIASAPASALGANNAPWNNPSNTLDVDDNRLVQPLDALLVINALLEPVSVNNVFVPPAAVNLTTVYYWDTSNDGYIAPYDALLVINHLLAPPPAPVPEPSAIIPAVTAATALLGYAMWRRRRTKAASLPAR